MVNFYSLQKWVKAFRFGLLEIVVNTNNVVERKKWEFQYDFLKQYKDKTLSGMVTVLIEHFIPDTYSRKDSIFHVFTVTIIIIFHFL